MNAAEQPDTGSGRIRSFVRHRLLNLTFAILAADLLTKYLVDVAMDSRASLEIIPGFLRISQVLNSGIAFGLFDDLQSAWKPIVLAGLAAVAVVTILVYGSSVPPGRRMLRLALAVTLGGIVGNFLDRLVDGRVIDFIEVHWLDRWYWPTFNVADSAITVGIILLVIDTVRNPDAERQAAPESAERK